MKHIFLSLSCFFFTTHLIAQSSTFETQPLPATNYWKGTPGVAATTPFTDGGVTYVNRNDTSSVGDYWSGWGYSATTDTVTASYVSNEMSAITGKGHNNSLVYGVAYLGWDSTLNRIKLPAPVLVNGCYVTNSTVAYLSMKNGDFAAKKFGGTSGNDPDFFRLDITGWHNGIPTNDTVHFYLADFRFANNANDYILKTWAFVDLSSLGVVDSLAYNEVSSDNNSFGMLTPSYFCMDDLQYTPEGVSDLHAENGLQMYPVPATNDLFIKNRSLLTIEYTVAAINGNTLCTGKIKASETHQIETCNWPSGQYMLHYQLLNNSYSRTFIKE